MVANQKRVAVEHEEKALQKKMKMLTRSQRTHRLCEQGAILGAKLKEPDLLTAEQVKAVLDVAFSHSVQLYTAMGGELRSAESLLQRAEHKCSQGRCPCDCFCNLPPEYKRLFTQK